MSVLDYKDLDVWQKAMDVATNIYVLVKRLPVEERYALSDQLRRAAISIPSNIAEGQSRHTKKEFANFLSIAQGSTSEVETQLLLAVRIGYFSQEDILSTMQLLNDIHRMIRGLQKRLNVE